MTMIPAVSEPSTIAPFFRALAQTSVPGRVDSNFMAGIGFRRQSDLKLLELLHFLGFMDKEFKPTTLWKEYFSSLDEDRKLEVLGKAVAERYADPLRIGGSDGSSQLNGKAVMAYFKGETGASDTETAYMVLTLQILLDLAKLPDQLPSPSTDRTCPVPPAKPPVEKEHEEKRVTITLNIDLKPGEHPELAELVRLALKKGLGTPQPP